MIKIGITGSIGTGKTTIKNIFGRNGFETYSSDEVVHELYKKDMELVSIIDASFPGTVKEGIVNRKKLRNAVFGDIKKTIFLESIVHSRVLKERYLFLKKCLEKNKDAVLEIPLLFEKKLEKNFDYIITTKCREVTQKKRVLGRNIDEITFYKIKKNQINQNVREKLSDFIIDTDNSLKHVYTNVIKIINKIK